MKYVAITDVSNLYSPFSEEICAGTGHYAVLLLHPYSALGGSMYDPVIYMLLRCASHGLHVI